MEWNRDQYSADLAKFSNLIEQFDSDQVFQKLSPILNKASFAVKHNSSNVITIDTQGIEIILKRKTSGCIPNDLDSVTIYLDSYSEFDTSIDIDTRDRIQGRYTFQIAIMGINSDGEHHNAWHLDKDIRHTGANPPKVSHPLYHFQAGGNRLEDKNISGAIFLSAPRLPHPPMDVILGLHFILKNFCSTKDYSFLENLFNNYDYENLIQRAKDRMFKPYFKAFEQGNTHQDFTVENVFPMAV